MENVRAFSIVHKLKDFTDELSYVPEDIIDNDESVEVIKREGFKVFLKTDSSYEKIYELLMQTVFLKDLEISEVLLNHSHSLISSIY
jgi:two-component system chemotaxis sensor kinase CheA